MSSSLDSLTKNLVRGGKKLFGFEDYSELQYDLLTRNNKNDLILNSTPENRL